MDTSDHLKFLALLKKYEGGQFEWHPTEGTVRGQVRTINLEKHPRPYDIWFNYQMTVEFDWSARLEPKGWVKSPNISIIIDTMGYKFNMLGSERLGMVSWMDQTLGVFYPPGGSALRPENVKEESDAHDSEA